MKTLEWQNFFAEQRALHGKAVFSVAELANAARTTLHTVNTELGRLVKRGLVTRYAQGRYGSSQNVAPEDVVTAVDRGAYVTGFHALFHRHLVTQVPAEVTCFTNRRHNRRSDRVGASGRLRFLHVPAGIYFPPPPQAPVPAEQALCDFVWLNLRDGVEPQSLVTFRNLHTLSSRRLNKTLQRYPANVRATVARIIQLN